jgi:NAD-dependent dihydropyrimidine dehydrogenase PreA subunit
MSCFTPGRRPNGQREKQPHGGHPNYLLEGKMGYTITIDTDKCTGDGECVDVCPVEVYELQDGKAVAVNEDECLGCESCVEVCENDAITVEEN